MATENFNSSVEDTQLRAEIDRSLRHPVMFFFTSAAAWLALSLVLGVISSAKVHSPGFLDCCSCFNAGVMKQAHMSTLIYGWGAQAAFGVIIWLMARLSRQKCTRPGIILAAGHFWNILILIGTVTILMGNGSGVAWMYFPKAIWPALIAVYFAIAIWSVIAFRVRRGGHIYISQWYIIAALFWFPWIMISGFLFTQTNLGDANPVMVTAASAWFRSALMFLFFTPVAIAAQYYLAPKVSGRPVYSYSLALFGFWALAIAGPWAGLQWLTGTPVPVFMTNLSAGAAILLIIPALMVAINVVKTAKSNKDALDHSPSLRFTVAGEWGLVAFTAIGALFSIPCVMKYVQFSIGLYGLELVGLLGFFSLSMFGAIYFIVPRITNREWISAKLISQHFWLFVYGIAFIALYYTLMGGFLHGVISEDLGESALSALDRVTPYAAGLTIGFVFIGIASFFFCCHLLLMWLRLGRRSNHPTLFARHATTSPHGAEGNVDKIEPSDSH